MAVAVEASDPFPTAPPLSSFVDKRAHVALTATNSITGQLRSIGAFAFPSKLSRDSNALALLNLTACLSVITGPSMLLMSRRDWKVSSEQNDQKGKRFAAIGLTRGVLQTSAAALCVLPATGITCALFFTACKSAAFAGALLNSVGSGLFSLAATLQMFSSALKIREGIQLRRSLLAHQDPKAALAELKERLKNPVELRGWLRTVDREEVEDAYLATDERAQQVVQALLKNQQMNLIMESLDLLLNLAGIGLGIAGFFLTGPMALYILGATGLLIGVCGVGLDIREIREAAKWKGTAPKEKTTLLLSASFSILIMAGAAYLSRGWAAMGISIFSGLILLAIHAMLYQGIRISDSKRALPKQN